MEEDRNGKVLAEMQHWDFAKKVAVAQTRIIEFYNRLDGKCFVSFSGGKDSTVLLHLTRQIFPDVEAVYVDTGLEYPEVRDFVKSFDNVTWIKPEKNFKRVIMEEGYPVISKENAKRLRSYWSNFDKGIDIEDYWYYKWATQSRMNNDGTVSKYNISDRWKKIMIDQRPPFKVSERCCNIMKKNPMHKYVRESGKCPIIGTMAEESVLRTQAWIKTGCNVFDRKNRYEVMSKPLSIWTEQDVFEYITRYNIQIPSVYGDVYKGDDGKWRTNGVGATGCMFCAFGSHMEQYPNRFQQMRVSHPKQWKYCMKPVSEGGLGMKEVLDYCGIPTGYDDQCQMSLLDDNDFIEI